MGWALVVINIDPVEDARRALGRRLATQRGAVGHTQESLAPLTGYSRSTVANVEKGRQQVARDFWARCDDVLGARGELIAAHNDLLDVVRRRDAEAVLAAEKEREERVRRLQRQPHRNREHGALPGVAWLDDPDVAVGSAVRLWDHDLRERTADPVTTAQVSEVALRWLVAPEDPRGESGRCDAGLTDVGRVRSVRVRLKDLDNAHGGGVAFPLALTFLRRDVAPLLARRPSLSVASALLGATAELVLDVGWMAYDAADHVLARRHMSYALRLAHAAGDRLLGGRVLAALSHQALHLGQVPLAVDLARAARTGTERVASPAATAMLAAMEACTHAAHHDAGRCNEALAAAEEALCRGSGAEEPSWLDFDEGGLWGHAARAYGDLGQPRAARRYAEKSIALCRSDHSRTRAQRYAILAKAEVQLGDLDRAAATASRIVSEAWNLRSGHVHQEIAALVGAIKPMRSPVASDFLDQAEELLAARDLASPS